MARARDWGDQYPSDLDDTPPANPTDGLEEIDYSLETIGSGARIKPANPRKENPELSGPLVKESKRTSFSGVVTAVGVQGRYQVLRQDGFLGEAQAIFDDRRYQQYEVGDLVDLKESQTPNHFYMQGSPRYEEYSTIDVNNEQDIGPFNTEVVVQFDSVAESTGTDLELSDGGVKILRDAYGLYEIHYTVVLECLDPDDTYSKGVSYIGVANTCIAFSEADSKKTNRIHFDKKVGFKVNNSDCAATVTIKIQETDFAPYSPSGGGIIKWSNEPWIASAIKVGTMVGQGWVKIESNGAGKLWLGHGAAECKLLFPDDDPSKVSHLYVKGITGKAVKLGWTPTPGCGNISVTEYGGQTKTWVVERGLIMSGPGITKCTESVNVVLTEPTKRDWECNES